MSASIRLTVTGREARYEDLRAGFVMTFPAAGELVAFDAAAIPRRDATLRIADPAVTVMLGLEPTEVEDDAAPLAAALALVYAMARSGTRPPVIAHAPDELARWGVDGAAGTSYRLPAGAREHVTVLVRAPGAAMVVAFTSAGRVDELRASALASIRWR